MSDVRVVLPVGFLSSLPPAPRAQPPPPPAKDPVLSMPAPEWASASAHANGSARPSLAPVSGGSKQFWKAGDYDGAPSTSFESSSTVMSVDGSCSCVMEGYKHGACHYLIKPIHEDDIRNIWQQAIRKKAQNNNHNKEHQVDNDAVPPAKKPRFTWTKERHQQFLNAVGQLGNKAVPTKILQLMNIPGLTRQNIASHLQKFRLEMKRESKANQEQNGVKLNGTLQHNNKSGESTRFSMQDLANADESENHYSHSSSNESSQQEAALTYDSNNNNIPYLYYHNDFISDSFIYDNIQPISYFMPPPS